MGQEQTMHVQQVIEFNVPINKIDQRVVKALTETTLGYIDLSKGIWRELHLNNVMPVVRKWKVHKGVVLDDNKDPYLLKSIEDINFPSLVELTLRGNNIESLENLTRIFLPSLQRLWFCGNKITTIRAIRKANFPNMRYLSFSSNELTDIQKISELDAVFLDELFIEMSSHKIQNLRGLAKSRSNNLHKIYMLDIHEDVQINVLQALRRKFLQLNSFKHTCKSKF